MRCRYTLRVVAACFLCTLVLWMYQRGGPFGAGHGGDAMLPADVVEDSSEACSGLPPVVRPVFASLGDSIDWTDRNPAAHRAREVVVHPGLLKVSLDAVAVGDRLDLELFDGEAVSATVTKRQLWGRDDATLALTARFADDVHAYMTLSSTGGVIRAWISQPLLGKDYQIRYDVARGSHVLLDVDMSSTETIACAACQHGVEHGHADSPLGDEVELSANQLQSDEPAYGDAVFGVMVVYTPAALNRERSLANLEANISEAINKSNVVLENSLTEVQLELVHSAEVSYTEEDPETDLGRLEVFGDDFMDEVHEWRDIYGADFVTLFQDTQATGGLAYQPFDHASPEYAFGLVRVQQADTASYTTIHELAHNMGIGHSKTQAIQAYNGNGIATYAAGWQWADAASPASIGYCSVMTYENFDNSGGNDYDRVAHLSNPSVSYNGKPTGDAVDGDAARVIREGRALLAAYWDPGQTQVSTFAYAFGFESSEPTWITSASGTLRWEQDQSVATPSWGTGPSSAEAGSQYAYVEASNLDYTEDNTAIIYADFDFTSVIHPQISFYYHMYDASGWSMGDLFLEVSSDGGSSWSALVALSGNQGNLWNQSTTSLLAYAGQTVRLRFRAVIGSGYQSDIAIDSLVVEDLGAPANFSEFLALNYPGLSDPSPTGDPDGDSVVNFLEYALDRSLSVAENDPPITAGYNESTNEFIFSFKRGQANVRYLVQSTDDLTDWTDSTIEWDSDANPVGLVAVGEIQSVAIIATDPKRFVRLTVSE
ncbi:MAG: zinc-dependent metalloprotease family protein [Opitutales bacterium]